MKIDEEFLKEFVLYHAKKFYKSDVIITNMKIDDIFDTYAKFSFNISVKANKNYWEITEKEYLKFIPIIRLKKLKQLRNAD
jgi:hypothetical protein